MAEPPVREVIVRPLAPTGAPGVGEPPVTVFEVIEASRRLGGPDEAPLATVRRAFPDLSEKQARAALAHGAEAAARLRPMPGYFDGLGLVLVRSLGLLMLIAGPLALTFVGAAGVILLAGGSPDLAGRWALGVLWGGSRVGWLEGRLWVIMGVGLLLVGARIVLRHAPRLRSFDVAFALLAGIAFSVARMPNALLLGSVALVWLVGIHLADARRWSTPGGRAAARLLATRASSSALAWGAMSLVFLFAIVPTQMKLLHAAGRALPLPTEALIEVSRLAQDFSVVVVAVAAGGAFGLAPLLLGRLPLLLDRRLAWPVHLMGALAVGAMIVALFMPLIQVYQTLP